MKRSAAVLALTCSLAVPVSSFALEAETLEGAHSVTVLNGDVGIFPGPGSTRSTFEPTTIIPHAPERGAALHLLPRQKS